MGESVARFDLGNLIEVREAGLEIGSKVAGPGSVVTIDEAAVDLDAGGGDRGDGRRGLDRAQQRTGDNLGDRYVSEEVGEGVGLVVSSVVEGLFGVSSETIFGVEARLTVANQVQGGRGRADQSPPVMSSPAAAARSPTMMLAIVLTIASGPAPSSASRNVS